MAGDSVIWFHFILHNSSFSFLLRRPAGGCSDWLGLVVSILLSPAHKDDKHCNSVGDAVCQNRSPKISASYQICRTKHKARIDAVEDARRALVVMAKAEKQ